MLTLALAVCLAAAPPQSAPCTGPEQVKTTLGCVQGDRVGPVLRFRGIPYASPPVGALRWSPPAPAKPWTDVRKALEFGKACPQRGTLVTGQAPAWDEDCLSLNVWTPKPGAAAKAPVMVWIHGGGLAVGASSLPYYDGAALAKQGVVLVSINYRLGPLGYLAHAAFGAHSGNQGLLDQIAALQFVKANAAAFGGDPANVTVFGESAGAVSTCALLASPLAAGLFHRAIAESGECVATGKWARALAGDDGAEAQGARVAKALGCKDEKEVLTCLRGKTAEQVLDALPAKVGFFGKGEKYAFALDGVALTRTPRAALDAGELATVPTIIGVNADEATLFTGKIDLKRPIGFSLVVKLLFRDDAPRVLAAYPLKDYASPKAAFDALVSDLAFACPARHQAVKQRAKQPHVYRYLFAHARGSKGAGHGTEIPFVFGTLTQPTAEESALSQAMQRYWVTFARTGDPNPVVAAGETALPKWLPSAEKDQYQRLDLAISNETGLRTAQCDVLDQLDGVDREPTDAD